MKAILLLLFVCFFFLENSTAQFVVGKHNLGPSIGSGFGGYGLSLGGDYEYGMKIPEVGIEASGLLGVGGLIRYYSWSNSFGISYTDIIIGAQGNYHFILENNKFDPWVGLVIGLDISSYSYSGPSYLRNRNSTSTGGFFFNLNAGARYWFSPKMAARASLGFGSIVNSLILGLDFRL